MPARIITPEMDPILKYRVGDTVAHVNLGDGIVTKGPAGCVQVTYKRRYKKSIKAVGGTKIVQNYDSNWFKRNPRFLFHRGDITPLVGDK